MTLLILSNEFTTLQDAGFILEQDEHIGHTNVCVDEEGKVDNRHRILQFKVQTHRESIRTRCRTIRLNSGTVTIAIKYLIGHHPDVELFCTRAGTYVAAKVNKAHRVNGLGVCLQCTTSVVCSSEKAQHMSALQCVCNVVCRVRQDPLWFTALMAATFTFIFGRLENSNIRLMHLWTVGLTCYREKVNDRHVDEIYLQYLNTGISYLLWRVEKKIEKEELSNLFYIFNISVCL